MPPRRLENVLNKRKSSGRFAEGVFGAVLPNGVEELSHAVQNSLDATNEARIKPAPSMPDIIGRGRCRTSDETGTDEMDLQKHIVSVGITPVIRTAITISTG